MGHLLSEEKLEEFRATHKRIAHVIGKNEAYECVFRKPTRVEWNRFKALLHDPVKVSGATETMALTLCVYPDRAAFNALLDDYPGIPEVASAKLLELANGGGEEEAKT